MKSIGIKLADGSFYPIMEDGKADSKTLSLTTVKDNQTTVKVDLYQSETGTMEDAKYLDTLQIEDLNPHPNGEPDFNLSLSLDEDNNLSAQVADPETNKSSSKDVPFIKRSEAERAEPSPIDAVEETEPSIEEPVSDGVEEATDGGESAADDDFDIDSLNLDTTPLDDTPAAEDTDSSDFSLDDMPATEEPAIDDTPAETAPNIEDTIPDIDETVPDGAETVFDGDGDDFDIDSLNLDDTPLDETVPDIEDTVPDGAETVFDGSDNVIDETAIAKVEDAPNTEDTAADGETSFDGGDFDIDSLDLDTTPIDDTPAAEENISDGETVFDGGESGEEEGFKVDGDIKDLNLDKVPEVEISEPNAAVEYTEEDFKKKEVSAEEDTDNDFNLDGLDDDLPPLDDTIAGNSDLDTNFMEEKGTDDFDSNLLNDGDLTPPDESFSFDDSPDSPEEKDEFGDTTDSIQLDDFDTGALDDTPSDSNAVVVSDSGLDLSDLDNDDAFTVPDFDNKSSDSTGAFNFDSDFDDPAFALPSASAASAAYNNTSSLDDFDNLTSDTTGGGSYNSYSNDSNSKKGISAAAVICIICAIICLLAAGLALFVAPSRLKMLSSLWNQADNVSAAQSIEQSTVAEEEPKVAPVAKENAIVVASSEVEMIPEKPVELTSINEEEVGEDGEKKEVEGIRYQIRWGDTLWDIADTYYRNPWLYPRIAKYNNITDPDFIVSGTYITIPK